MTEVQDEVCPVCEVERICDEYVMDDDLADTVILALAVGLERETPVPQFMCAAHRAMRLGQKLENLIS